MSNAPNYLRLYRKRSPLTQSDIAYLLQLPDVSNVSRYEKNQRSPNIEMLLTYHLLFNVAIEEFFEQDSVLVHKNLVERSEKLLTTLKNYSTDQGHNSRINYLEQVINRLTN